MMLWFFKKIQAVCYVLILSKCALVYSANQIPSLKQILPYLPNAYLHLSTDDYRTGFMFTKQRPNITNSLYWIEPNIICAPYLHIQAIKPLWVKGSIGMGYRHYFASIQKTLGMYFYYDYGLIASTPIYAVQLAHHTIELGIETRARLFKGSLFGYMNFYPQSIRDRNLLELKDKWGGHMQISYDFWNQYRALITVYYRYIWGQAKQEVTYGASELYPFSHTVSAQGFAPFLGVAATIEYAVTNYQSINIGYNINNWKQGKWIIAYNLGSSKRLQFENALRGQIARYGRSTIFIDENNIISNQLAAVNIARSRQKHQDFLKIVQYAAKELQKVTTDITLSTQAATLWLRLPREPREQLYASQMLNGAERTKAGQTCQANILDILNKHARHTLNFEFLPYDPTRIIEVKDALSVLKTFFENAQPLKGMTFIEKYPYLCEIFTGENCEICRQIIPMEIILQTDFSSEKEHSTGNVDSSIFV